MTKTMMMDRFDEVVTDRRLRRGLVEEHLAASTQIPSLLLDDYVCLASGGSSGLRGIFVQTVGEFAEFGASLTRRAMARMVAAGGLPPEGVVVALVGAAAPVHTTGFGAAVLTRAPIRYIEEPAGATLPLTEIVARLNALQPPLLMGYPSKLTQLAREQQAGRLRIAPRAITVTSEMSTAEDRAAIAIGFGAPVINQFGATEGLVGHSDADGDVLTFASDTCIVELVDAENRPVGEGTASAKVLVTNLHNFTQPLIRYELTDRLLRHPDAPDHGHLRATVLGQTDQTFRYEDLEVHPLVIRTIMVKTPAVSEYQARQTQQGIDMDVVAENDLRRAALTAALQQSLHAAGLPAPRVGRADRRLDRPPPRNRQSPPLHRLGPH